MPAVSVHHTPTTDSAWDGPAQVAKLGNDYTTADLKALFAWVPSGADPKKGDCSFPHHMVGSDGKPGAANVKACQSVISILNGGMGGSNIPAGDRKGVYNHVAAHLKDAGETPAELKSSPWPLHARAAAPRTVERRNVPFQGVELRADPDGTGGERLTFRGYACVVDRPYEMEDLFGSYNETVRSGAFKKTLSEGADVPFLINHGGLTLARTKSGTLQLAEDSMGLHVEASLDPANPEVQKLRSAMDRKDVDEMSFAFWPTRQAWNEDYTKRDILEVNLNRGDVSVVNYGANPHTAGATLSGAGAVRGRDVVSAFAELRAGATLTPEAMATLGHVLQLVSAADAAVDVAQPLLAEVLGVPNPDADEPDEDDTGDMPAMEQDAAGLELYELRARLLALQPVGSSGKCR